MVGFRKLTENEVWRSSWLRAARGRFAAPSGEEFERDIVHHPGAVVVVPMVDDHRVVCVRQYRGAIDQELLEIPAGKRDVADEPPEVTAARELAEEVGRTAGSLTLLAHFYNSPGFSDELSWLYLARDLTEVGNDLQGVEESNMTEEIVSLDDLDDLVASGSLTDAKTIIGLTLADRARRRS